MRSPPRKPTASGSSKSSFHSKTPDGVGTSPAPPFSFPAPQQKAGIPGEAKEDILSVPAGGSSHYGARGKESLAQSPLPLRPPPETWGTPPYTVTAIRFLALMGRQSCRFLESTSLYPPPAALWCFPLWKSFPRKDGGATVEREAEDVLFATPVCEGLSGAGTH